MSKSNFYKCVSVIVILMLLSLFSVERAIAGTTYYVSPEGSDDNSGAISSPFKTIQKAVDIVVAGDTVIVRDGVYADYDYDGKLLSIDGKRGTSGNWITFKSENQHGAVLDGQLSNYTHVTGWTKCTNSTCGSGSATDIYWATVNHQVNYVHHGRLILADEPINAGGLGAAIRKTSISALTASNDFYYDAAAQKLYYKYSGINNRYFIATEGTTYAFLVTNSSYVKFEGFEIKNTMDGAFIGPSNNIYFYRNKFHDLGRVQKPCDQPGGMYGGGVGVFTYDSATYTTIDSNIFHTLGRLPANCNNDYNHDHALYLYGDSVRIVNNLFYNQKSGWNVLLSGSTEVNPEGVKKIEVVNNTFYGKNPERDGHIMAGWEISDALVENNISHTPGAHFIENQNGYAYQGRYSTNNPPKNIVRNNLVYGGGIANYVPEALYTTFTNNTIGQDPLFVNLIKYDFHPKSGSPAIDAGLNIGLSVDIEGNLRVGTPDMGAYEYTGTSVDPPITDNMPPSSPIAMRTVAAPSSILSNSGFELGTSPWVFYTNGAGTFNVDAAGNGSAQAGHIVITSAGTNVQLHQANVALEPNTLYQLSFKAYSNTGHDVRVALHKHGSPYTSYGLSQAIDLTASWQDYSVQFTTSGFTGAVNDGRLVFLLSSYNASGDEYFFDDVVLTKLGGSN